MADPIRWPDVERLVVAWLEPRAALLGAVVYRETESDVDDAGFVKRVMVSAVGGSARWVERDADVEVQVLAVDRASMWSLARLVQRSMHELAGSGNDHGAVDEVVETFAFAPIPYPDPDVRRATATFTLSVRPIT